MAEQEQRQQQPQEKNGRGSVSERARRIQRQLQWRRARGADRAFALDVGGHQLEAIQITGGETSGLGTGAIVWDCAVVLSKYLEKNLKSFQPPPASIVELGSGNGLLGMVCALFFDHAKVVVTEQAPLLPLIHQNLEHNGTNNPRVADVEVVELNWGDRNEQLEADTISWIVVSDCVFNNAPYDLLVDSLVLLAKPETKILISIEHRNHKHEDLFWQAMKEKNFGVETVSREDLDEDFSADDIDVYFLSPPPLVPLAARPITTLA